MRDQRARSRRARERHHVDIGVARERLTHRRAVAIHKVKDTCRHAGLIHDFGIQIGRQRRDFTWLQHHRAADGQCRRDFAAHLIERPVPRCNQAANADRLFHNAMRAKIFGEGVGFENFRRLGNVAKPGVGLRGAREFNRRAHLQSDRLRDFTDTALKDFGHAF